MIASVQLGRRAWGLGSLLNASVLVRLLLVGLNLFAVAMAPGAADRLAWHVAEQRAWIYGPDDEGADAEPDSDTIMYQGSQVCEVEVRDARGQVIPTAYVWDLTGDRPLPMTTKLC